MQDFEVLGVPLRVAGDVELASSLLLERLFAVCSSNPGVLELCVVEEDESATAVPGAPSFSVQSGRFEIESAAGAGWADQALGRACARLRREESSNGDERATLLETLAIYLAYGLRPIVLHAASVVHNDVCVLLTGAEGAGKTTLTYACLLAGMKVLSDDLVYFSAPDSPVAWGHPTSLYLMRDAVSFFPELSGYSLSRRLNGEEKLRVPLLTECQDRVVLSHEVDAIVVLKRGREAASHFEPADRAEVVEALTGIRGDPPLDAEMNAETAHRLALLPHVCMRLGSDPIGAVEPLKRWIEGLPQRCM